jgi:hypothetical protein
VDGGVYIYISKYRSELFLEAFAKGRGRRGLVQCAKCETANLISQMNEVTMAGESAGGGAAVATPGGWAAERLLASVGAAVALESRRVCALVATALPLARVWFLARVNHHMAFQVVGVHRTILTVLPRARESLLPGMRLHVVVEPPLLCRSKGTIFPGAHERPRVRRVGMYLSVLHKSGHSRALKRAAADAGAAPRAHERDGLLAAVGAARAASPFALACGLLAASRGCCRRLVR